jgi:hypothetical protein
MPRHLRQLFFSFCQKDRPKACGFRKVNQLFFFEKKSCKKSKNLAGLSLCQCVGEHERARLSLP